MPTKITTSFAIMLAIGAGPAFAQAQTPPQNRGDSPGSAPKSSVPMGGAEVYTQVCQACHMADARGGSGAGTIPALAGNPRLATPGYPISMIVRGRGAMPSLTDILGPVQIANVVTYIRTHFGNNYPAPVTQADVARIVASKPAP